MKYNQTETAYSFQDLNVDKEDGIISKVLLARVGKAKGHGEYVDETFTNQIVEQGKGFSQGMKARFGHPNASSTTLGTFIGRWKNFQFENGSAYADLHLDAITKKTQLDGKGISMWEYITEMASNNPDMFGNSIVFRPAKHEEKTVEVDNGEIDNAYDEIIEQKESTTVVRRVYSRIKALIASDLVDSPAATESLFSQFSKDEDFAYHATTFLDDNPKLYELLDKNPEVFKGFMEKYNDYKTKKTEMSETKTELSSEEVSWFKSMFSKRKEVAEPVAEDTVSDKEKELSSKIEELSTQFTEQKEANEALIAKVSEQEASYSELEAKYNEAQEKLGKYEVEESGDKPAVDPKVDDVQLSEREIELNKVAEAMKDK
jgi:hypothetical protein